MWLLYNVINFGACKSSLRYESVNKKRISKITFVGWYDLNDGNNIDKLVDCAVDMNKGHLQKMC